MLQEVALHAFFVQGEKRLYDVDTCQYVLSSTQKQDAETQSGIRISRIEIQAVTEELWIPNVVGLRSDTATRAAVERHKNRNNLRVAEDQTDPVELNRDEYYNYMESKRMTVIIRTPLPYLRKVVALQERTETSLAEVLQHWWRGQRVCLFRIPPMSELVLTTEWMERFDWPGLLVRDIAFRDMAYLELQSLPDEVNLDIMSKGDDCMYMFRTMYLTDEVDGDEVESWGSLDVKPGTDHDFDSLSGFYGSPVNGEEGPEPPTNRFNAIMSWLARLE